MIHFIIVGILVIVSTLLMGYGLINADLFPTQASQQAVAIDQLFHVHIWLISFFVSLIVVFILYSLVVFRRRRGDESDGKYFEGNAKLELYWTAIPLVIVIGLAVFGAGTLSDVERRDPGALEVNVIAQQWSWRFEYPETGAVSNQLYLPVNRQVLLRMRSQDVIHSFWVPEFRVKQDVLPGDESFVRELRITPNEEGEFKVRCAELCGTEHYAMLADVIVVPPAEFETWVTAQAAECDEDDAVCGKRWVNQYGCLSCHSLDGSSGTGPTWQGLMTGTEMMDDGTPINVDAIYLHESIVDPNAKIVEGFQPNVMPGNFAEQLTEEQINQIVAFLLTQTGE
ncbi:MAG: cytochrome c oxidase subunit II [Anaerolineales bacterium]|nr:cytochrome c oxidase subunit II [Anaerolineales bacterium]